METDSGSDKDRILFPVSGVSGLQSGFSLSVDPG